MIRADVPGVFLPLPSSFAMEEEDDEVVSVILTKLLLEVAHKTLFVLPTFHANTSETAIDDFISEGAPHEIADTPVVSGVEIFFKRRGLRLGFTINVVDGVDSGPPIWLRCARVLVVNLVHPFWIAIPIDGFAVGGEQVWVHGERLLECYEADIGKKIVDSGMQERSLDLWC